jgi:hypothetical protein
MKRVWWVAKIAVLVAASYCIFTPSGPYTLRNAKAAGCDKTERCRRNTSNDCYCPTVTIGGPGCDGCFVPNNSPDCGRCTTNDQEVGI